MKMIPWTAYILTATGLLVSLQIPAYELLTHAELTEKAFDASVLTINPELLGVLGLEKSDPINPFGTRYFLLHSKGQSLLTASTLSDRFNSTEKYPLDSIAGWMKRGAIREDDYLPATNGDRIIGCNPDPEIPAEEGFHRPVHHFFDPVRNSPLEVGLPMGFISAPRWALGTWDAFASPVRPDGRRKNHFSLFDAREAMYRALTGQASDGGLLIGADGEAGTEAVRNAYWATLFRSLGDIIHLVQDMAQPQHTRNDPHNDECNRLIQAFVTGGTSVYEKYVDARARRNSTDRIYRLPKTDNKIKLPGLSYGSLAPRVFDNYASYFSTRHQDDFENRQGLADFSNREFFSTGTNLNLFNARYTSPPNEVQQFGKKLIHVDWNGNPLPGGGTATLLTRTVTDHYPGTPSAPAQNLSTHSIWDQFLQDKHRMSASGLFSIYTLNRYNYDDMADQLIPRAVAYSAGFINRFFRGRIDLTPDPDNPGGFLLKNLGNETLEGRFALFYDGNDDELTRLAVGDAARWDVMLPPMAEIAVNAFSEPELVPPDTGCRYMLAFHGKMGDELNAVIGQHKEQLTTRWESFCQDIFDQHAWNLFHIGAPDPASAAQSFPIRNGSLQHRIGGADWDVSNMWIDIPEGDIPLNQFCFRAQASGGPDNTSVEFFMHSNGDGDNGNTSSNAFLTNPASFGSILDQFIGNADHPSEFPLRSVCINLTAPPYNLTGDWLTRIGIQLISGPGETASIQLDYIDFPGNG